MIGYDDWHNVQVRYISFSSIWKRPWLGLDARLDQEKDILKGRVI